MSGGSPVSVGSRPAAQDVELRCHAEIPSGRRYSAREHGRLGVWLWLPSPESCAAQLERAIEPPRSPPPRVAPVATTAASRADESGDAVLGRLLLWAVVLVGVAAAVLWRLTR